MINPNSLLDELPKYSSWPKRLLDPKSDSFLKSPEGLMQEYDIEKWGKLRARIECEKLTPNLKLVDSLFLEAEGETLCSNGDELRVMSALDAHMGHLDMVREALEGAGLFNDLVELGAGYGAVLLHMAKAEVFSAVRFHAGEYTPSGVELLRDIANSEQIKVNAGLCDFSSIPLTNFKIPYDAVIYTSLSLLCLPCVPESFMDQLIDLRPKRVFHFEPIFEHCSESSLLGLMRRRYFEMNNYNLNLYSLLHEYEKRGLIYIDNIIPAAYGANPLLSSSVISWRPT